MNAPSPIVLVGIVAAVVLAGLGLWLLLREKGGPIPPPLNPCDDYEIDQDYILQGHDLDAGTYKITPCECAGHCNDVDGCNSFNWYGGPNKDFPNCWIKRLTPPYPEPYPNNPDWQLGYRKGAFP